MTQTNGTIWNYSYFYGVEISKDEIEQGYINYSTLAKGLGDVILANEVIPQTMAKGFYWEIEQGTDYNEETEEYIDIYQYYIISHRAAEILEDVAPDEIVYYNEDLDLYIWGVTHYGTPWQGVNTNIKIELREG